MTNYTHLIARTAAATTPAHERTLHQVALKRAPADVARRLNFGTVGSFYDGSVSFEQFGRDAGLTNWAIHESPVQYHDAHGALRSVADKKVLSRDDSGARLGVVGDKYKTVQPGDVYGFFKEFADAGQMQITHAGLISGGEKFFALAQVDASFTLGDDAHLGFISLRTSADGSSATEAAFIDYRLACTNGLHITNERAIYRVSHRSMFDAQALRSKLVECRADYQVYADDMYALAAKPVTPEMAGIIIAGLVNPAAVDYATGAVDGIAMDKARESKGFASMLSLFSGAGRGAMHDNSRGTMYGILQAATEYYSHHVAARSDENRFASAHFAAGAKKKILARDLLVDLARR